MAARIPKRPCRKCLVPRAESAFTGPRGHTCAGCRRSDAKARHRKQRLAVYELTPAEYEALMAAQGNTCAICKAPRRYNLHVDHDHSREKYAGSRASVRGGLCKRCNKLLALAHDDVELLEAAIRYLLNPPAWDVLGTHPEPDA